MTVPSWSAGACIRAGTGSSGADAWAAGRVCLSGPQRYRSGRPRGMMLDSRDICLRAGTARMWRDEAGWAGTAVGRRACIHLVGRDETAAVELALSPLSDVEDAWAALRRAGIAAASSP